MNELRPTERTYYCLILIFGFTMVARGQSTLSDKYYQLGWDNDVFMMTDYYYTQGINFTTYHPFFRHNPLNLVLIKPKRYTHLVNGFSASQKTYTPKDIKSNEIQYADRPYAGVLTFTSHVRVANADKGTSCPVEERNVKLRS